MLRLKATAGMPDVRDASLSYDAAVEKIAGIELHARLRRRDFHDAAALRFMDGRGISELSAARAQNEVVIITAGQPQLLVIVFDARPYRRRRGEVHRRIVHGPKLAGRNQPLANRSKRLSIDRQFMIEN